MRRSRSGRTATLGKVVLDPPPAFDLIGHVTTVCDDAGAGAVALDERHVDQVHEPCLERRTRRVAPGSRAGPPFHMRSASSIVTLAWPS